MNNIDQFFKDLKVVELASVLAGPAVGLFFAELGAEVIKIENKSTGGDVTRQWKSSVEEASSPASAYYYSVNYNKTSILLNLSDDVDRSVAYAHIRDADVVISNFKPRSAESIGMDYNTLKRIRHDIIYGSISAYGPGDPSSGFDALIQAETGWMDINGAADGPPVKLPVALIDILSAHQLKEGILIALLHRMRTGEGSCLDVSLYDTAVASLANQASTWLNLGILPVRMGSQHPTIAPYGDIIMTSDGVALLLAIGNDHQFKSFCDIIELTHLAADNKFSSNMNRVKNRIELMEILLPKCKTIASDHIIDQCKTLKVPISPINNLKEVFSDPRAQRLVLTQKEGDGLISSRVKSTVFRPL